MKKKVMVLGSGGMAGHVITLKLKENAANFDVVAVSRNNEPVLPDVVLDISDLDALHRVLNEQKPDVIINCVGILNQNAEIYPDNAILMNSYLPQHLARFTAITQTKLIHISTDCVFSGKKGAYVENDVKDGLGYYAQTKSLGEVVNDKDLTIRTSIIGPELKTSGIGLFNWFANQNGIIKGYTQAYWTGVTTPQLADNIIAALHNEVCGLYHLVNREKISKFSLLQLFLQAFEKSGVDDVIASDVYTSDKSLINTRHDYNMPVPDYRTMIEEMKLWMLDHIQLYPHYAAIL